MILKKYLELNCEIISSINISRLKKGDELEAGLIKVYLPSVDALVEGILDINKCKVMYIPKGQLKYCLQKGDILLKCQNETLVTIINDDNIICPSYAIGVKVREKNHLYELVSTLTSNEFYKIGNLSRVALVNRINTNDIMNYEINTSIKKGELLFKFMELDFLKKQLHILEQTELEQQVKKYKNMKI